MLGRRLFLRAFVVCPMAVVAFGLAACLRVDSLVGLIGWAKMHLGFYGVLVQLGVHVLTCFGLFLVLWLLWCQAPDMSRHMDS